MDQAEIARNVRQARDILHQIAIEAELNACSKDEIIRACVEQGVLLPWNDEELKKQYDQGLTDGKLGMKFGKSAFAARNWRAKKGLPPNTQGGSAAGKAAESPEPAAAAEEASKEPVQAGCAEAPHCACCGMEIPDLHGISMYVAAEVDGAEYQLCPECAQVVVWLSKKRKAAGL